MTLVQIEQNSPEWLEWRRAGIGASDAAIVMGESPWMSPYDLWLVKMGQKEVFETEAMKEGKRLESYIRGLYEEQTGRAVFSACYHHPEYKWMLASVDGISLCGQHGVELKSMSEARFDTVRKGIVPREYFIQVQQTIFVMGKSQWDLFIFNKGTGETALFTIPRDQEFLVEMVEKELLFYGHMERKEPPAKKQQAPILPGTEELVQNIVEAHRNAKFWSEKLDALKDELKAKDMEMESGPVRVFKKPMLGKVSYDKIPELKGVDLEPYREASKSIWTVTVKQ